MFKLILFEQLKENNVEMTGEISSSINKESLASYIEELNKKDEITINEIGELAHAWGHDHVSNLEAYLFLKKTGATLEKAITLDDIENYLKFEAKYSSQRVATNIMALFTMIYPDAGQRGRTSVKEYLYFCENLIKKRTVLSQYKTYFGVGDWEEMQIEMDNSGIIDGDEVRLTEFAKHIEEQITYYPK